MKIKIGKYKNWLGPYQLAEKLCFWAKKDVDEYGFKHTADWVHKFGDIIAHGHIVSKEESDRSLFSTDVDRETWIYKLLIWIDSKRHRDIQIHIDKWDTWSMDSTLALIIVPMLKQLRNTTHGYPSDFIVNVNDYSRQKSFEGNGFEIDEDAGFDEWKDTLNKMIWAFEQVLDDNWEEQYSTGEIDFRFKKIEQTDKNGKPYSELIHGPNHTLVTDYDGIRKHQARMQEGFALFGKFYLNLWD